MTLDELIAALVGPDGAGLVDNLFDISRSSDGNRLVHGEEEQIAACRSQELQSTSI